MAKTQIAQTSGGNWLQYLLPVALVILSLVRVTSLNDPATLPRTLIWTGAILIWAIWKLRTTLKSADFALPAIPKWALGSMGILLAAHVISLLVAYNLAEGILATLRMATLLSGIVLIHWQLASSGEKGKRNWLFAIWAMGLIQAILAIVGFLSDSKLPPVGTQVNSNLLGVLVVLAIPAAAYLLWQGPAKMKLWMGISLPILSAATYFSASRTALLILVLYAIGIAVMGFFALRKHPIFQKNSVLIFVSAGLIIAATSFLMYRGFVQKGSIFRFRFLTDSTMYIVPQTSSVDTRLILWNRSLQMAKKQPFTGVGAGNWKLEIQRYGVVGFDDEGHYGSDFFIRPHNDYLWILSETGIFGLAGFLLLFGGLLVMGFRQIRRSKDLEAAGFSIVAFMILMGYLIDSFFAFPSERTENTILVAAMAAFILNANLGNDSNWLGKTWQKAILAMALLTFSFQFGIALYKLPKDAAVAKMRSEKAKQDWKGVGQEAEKADSWWSRFEAQSTTPISWYKTVSLVEQARSLGGPGVVAYDQMMEKALKEAQLALEYAPNSFLARTELSSTYAQMNRHADAAAGYEALLKVYPNNDEARVNLAICFLNLQNIEASKAALDKLSEGYQSAALNQLRAILNQQ